MSPMDILMAIFTIRSKIAESPTLSFFIHMAGKTISRFCALRPVALDGPGGAIALFKDDPPFGNHLVKEAQAHILGAHIADKAGIFPALANHFGDAQQVGGAPGFSLFCAGTASFGDLVHGLHVLRPKLSIMDKQS